MLYDLNKIMAINFQSSIEQLHMEIPNIIYFLF